MRKTPEEGRVTEGRREREVKRERKRKSEGQKDQLTPDLEDLT